MTSIAPWTTANRLLIDDLAKTVGERNVVWKPEDLLLYEYDGSIDRAAPRDQAARTMRSGCDGRQLPGL